MDMTGDNLLRAYLDARLAASRYPDDPGPVAAAWMAQRILERMLLARGWTDIELDAAFNCHERASLLRLDATGWRTLLVEEFVQRADRGVRVARALARYGRPSDGRAD